MKGLAAGVPAGSWMLLNSTTGLRVVRLLEIKSGKRANFEELRSEIIKDWRNEALAKVTTDAVHELAARYRVHRREDRR